MKIKIWLPLQYWTTGWLKGRWTVVYPGIENPATPIPEYRWELVLDRSLGRERTQPLTSSCRVEIDEKDIEIFTNKVEPSDEDLAFTRACLDARNRPEGTPADGSHERQVFGEIAEAMTATGRQRKAILRRALDAAVVYGLSAEAAALIRSDLSL
jgi:hypothetical protein